MHILMDNFYQGVKYSSKIASNQVELRREEIFTDQKSSCISSLQTDYLNLDRKSGSSKDSERENIVQIRCNFVGGVNHSAETFFKMI